MTDEQLKAARGRDHAFPDGARRRRAGLQPVPGVTDLKFTGALLADIFLGKVKVERPAIAKGECGRDAAEWPDITVVHRSDGSGTTYILVDYPKAVAEWKENGGWSTALNWPAGVGGKGNGQGVAGLVKPTPGAIGYVRLIYALQNKLAFGSVQNANGEFVKASTESVTAAAAAAAAQMPADFRVSITNAAGAGAYPISSFTWLLLYENPKDKARRRRWSTS